MENPISLRIWAPNAEGQTRQFTSGWDEYSSYDIPVDPTINGDIDYIVEAKGGFEIYRGVFNSLRYRSREYCIIVELRIKSGFVLVHQSDKRTPVSPGILLREVLKHIIDNYLKESFGKYKYLDEDHVAFEDSRIRNILAPYTSVSTWGKRVQMIGDNKSYNVKASSDSEVDAVLLAIPTATSLAESSQVVVGDFKTGGAMAQDLKSNPDCQRIYVRCQRADGATVDKELAETPVHLKLSDFALDPEVYKPVEVILDRDNILENFRLDKKVFNPAQGVTVTLYSEQQRVAVTITPEEQTQNFNVQLSVNGIGEVTPQLTKSLLFKGEPLNGRCVSTGGPKLKKFRHLSPDELKALFSLPSQSEYFVESVQIHNDTISVRVKMRQEYVDMRRRQHAAAQNNGNRTQSNAQSAQQESQIITRMLDVDCPMTGKKDTVDVRIIFSGNGMRIVQQFMAEKSDDGRIRQEINMPRAMRATIELGSPAKYTAFFHEDPRQKESKLAVSAWSKVNPIKRFFRRFYFRYDDNRSFWTRAGVIALLVLVLLGGGFALGAAIFPGIKAKIEESRRAEQTQVPAASKPEDKPEPTSEESKPAETEVETAPVAEADNTQPAGGEAAAPAEPADKAGDVKKDDVKAPSGAASKTEREKAQKDKTDDK